MWGEAVDGGAKTFDNVVEGFEDFVAEAALAYFLPNLFDGVHLGRVGREIKKLDVWRFFKVF